MAGVVKALVTGAGAPGIAGTLESLVYNPESRPVVVHMVDMDPRAVGQYFYGGSAPVVFHRVPPAGPAFAAAIGDLVAEHEIDVVLPQVTAELPFLESWTCEGVEFADKRALFGELRTMGAPWLPQTHCVSRRADMMRASRLLGYPERPVAVKPPDGNGMRGFRKIAVGKARTPFLTSKPQPECSLSELLSILHEDRGDEEQWPTLMFQEYLPGAEYTVDVLSSAPGVFEAVVPRRRDVVRSGITFRAVVEEHQEIIETTKRIATELEMAGLFGFQFKLDPGGRPKLLECNPRVQGTMAASSAAGANVIWGAVKLALGEKVEPMTPRWGTVYQRYWGGVGLYPEPKR